MAARLLVLDDDAAVGATIQAIAEEVGFETILTTGADDFLLLVEEWHPTHVAIDLIMPKTDGVQVLRELARRGCSAGVIITSGAGPRVLEAARRASIESGLSVLGIVAKPFDINRFCALLMGSLPEAAGNKPISAAPTPANVAFIAADLERAIEQRQVFLNYQPKIRCADGSLAGVEALARWHHPESGPVAPNDFIPVAESTGLIDQLTNLVFDTSLAWFGALRDREGLHLSVNLSAITLADEALPERLLGLCYEHGVNPKQIVLEVTETAAMNDPATVLGLTTRLRLKGFQLSIDDFGIGYSSLAQLARLPFSEMKVDRSFVQDISWSDEARKIVLALVGLGQSMGLMVSAEGVEDSTALNFLRNAGCNFAQGYLIGRPADGDRLSTWAIPASGSARAAFAM